MSFVVRGATLAAELLQGRPSITTWSRLEVVPATPDLGPGLQAQLADPLWLIGRQWQMLELAGEDGGSPIDVRVDVEAAPIERYHAGVPPARDAAAAAVDYATLDLPLEVMIEQEPVRRSHPRLRVEAGLHFLSCLDAEQAGAMAARYLEHEPFLMRIERPADAAADPEGAALAELTGAGVLDGAALARSFRSRVRADGTIGTLPAAPAIPAARRAAVIRAAMRWLAWYDGGLTDPAEDTGAWNPARLEYGLALGAHMEAGPVTLVADEYTDGRLDWYSFRAAAGPDLGRAATPPESTRPPQPAMLPSAVRYPGMPASRFWEFEDTRVNLAQLEASRTDLTRLLLVEFGLAYGDDWFLVPVDLPVGTVTRVRSCTVRDTFGEIITVGPSRNPDGSRWSMFELATEPGAPAYLRDLLFLPPALPRVEMGAPVEAVALFRDEMANVVWGVERVVQGVSGDRLDRYREPNQDPLRQVMPDAPAEALLSYRLASPVPRHWIPFVAVPAGGTAGSGAVQLERRALLRFVEGQDDPELIHPRGQLLRSDPAGDVTREPPLRIEDGEVPRDGVLVERAFQHTRWLGGRSLLWLGRCKRVSDGEGASRLVFDTTHRADASGGRTEG